MEKNKCNSKYLLVVIMIIMIIFLFKTGEQSGESASAKCIIKCTLQCFLVNRPLCVSECLKRCDSPVSQRLSTCVYRCANSNCTIFKSGLIQSKNFSLIICLLRVFIINISSFIRLFLLYNK